MDDDKGREQMKPGDEAPPGEGSAAENICPECSGSGRLNGEECPSCLGTGTVQQGVGGG